MCERAQTESRADPILAIQSVKALRQNYRRGSEQNTKDSFVLRAL